MYNTGNPIGSTAPKDFSDNSEITDRYVNDVVNETTLDRFGRSRLNIHGQQEKARRSFEQFESDAANVIANLGFFPPVDYATGLTVDSRNFTVTYNDVVYAAQPSAVPFTTGAWDAAQWYPIQNVLNQKNLLVFDTYAEASAAAATLPDGQEVEAPNDEGRLSRFDVQNGALVFKDFTPDAIRLQSYTALRAYTGKAQAVDITTPAFAGRFNLDDADTATADNGGTVIVGTDGRRWKRIISGGVQTSWFEGPNNLQKALDSGANVVCVTSGTSIAFDSVTMAQDAQVLVLEAGSELQPQSPTAKAITISGAGCAIVGPGTIKGKPVFDGANVRPTYALLWVTGNRFTLKNVTIDTVPKEAIMFEDSTGHIVSGNRFIGRYPYESYDEDTTTNHCAVMSNIPPLTSDNTPHILITGNIIDGFIQGCLMANYGSEGANTGVMITGNVFRNCWDHGVYMSRGKGHNISGNNFLNCRRPIVSDGVNSVVSNNVMYATDDETRKNCEQIISVRESSYSVISNNTINGIDAAIFLDCIETTSQVGNRIEGNVLVSRGNRYATACIRFGAGAQVCERNVIANNSLFINAAASDFNPIEGSILAGFFGAYNDVHDNVIKRTTPGPLVTIIRHYFVKVSGNRCDVSGAAASAVSMSAISLLSCSEPAVDGNEVVYSSGGANVSITGISVDSNSSVPKVTNNRINARATVAAYTPISLAVAGTRLRNQTSVGLMSGSATIPSGMTEVIIGNTNVTPDTAVNVIPRNLAAASVVANGYYVLSSVSTFRIVANAAPAADALFAYEVL